MCATRQPALSKRGTYQHRTGLAAQPWRPAYRHRLPHAGSNNVDVSERGLRREQPLGECVTAAHLGTSNCKGHARGQSRDCQATRKRDRRGGSGGSIGVLGGSDGGLTKVSSSRFRKSMPTPSRKEPVAAQKGSQSAPEASLCCSQLVRTSVKFRPSSTTALLSRRRPEAGRAQISWKRCGACPSERPSSRSSNLERTHRQYFSTEVPTVSLMR